MKTVILIVCAICISTIGLSQRTAHEHNLKPGVVYVFHTPEGQMIIEGYPPHVDPLAISEINPAFLNPIDGAGPIAMDPTAIKRINPNHNFVIRGIYPGQNPLSKKSINPEFLNPIDKIEPANIDPWASRPISPSWSNNWY